MTQGFAIQTGFSLALACDYRIADTTAKMGSATLRFGLLRMSHHFGRFVHPFFCPSTAVFGVILAEKSGHIL